jgi:hypothetical protein
MIILQQTRGLLSSNDELALDLPLAETKSITARVGPTPVFTRATTATYFGPKIEAFGYVLDFNDFINGRARWYTIFDPINGYTIAVYYNGTQWELEYALEEINYFYAAAGSEWRPDQADWSGAGISVTASSNFGIIGAANNEPRFEHDPLTGVCRGLLLEQSRTNTCLQSENFGTAWINDTGNVAISLDQTTSPSGAMVADKISENTTTSVRRIAIQTQAIVSGTTYTFSCFVKAAERDFVQLRFGSAFGGQFQNFVIGGVNAGTIGSGVGATAAIQAYPNGWYRCSITATSATTGSSHVTIGPQISSTALGWQPYVGTIGSGIFVWGAQNEAGATATSYIPTTTGSLARSQDLYTITGANFTDMYNQSRGTVFCAVTAVGATSATSGVYGIHAPTRSNGCVAAEFTSTLFRSSVHSTAFASQALFQTTASRNVLVKNAAAFRTDDFANSCNGNIATDTSGTLPAIMDRFVIGATGNTSGPQIGNNIFSSIKYYRKRLPNPKLQALTQ